MNRLWSLYVKEPTLEKYKKNVQSAAKIGDGGAILSIRARIMKKYGPGMQLMVDEWIKCDEGCKI